MNTTYSVAGPRFVVQAPARPADEKGPGLSAPTAEVQDSIHEVLFSGCDEALRQAIVPLTDEQAIQATAALVGLPTVGLAVSAASGGVSGAGVRFVGLPGQPPQAVLKVTRDVREMAEVVGGSLLLKSPWCQQIDTPDVLGMSMTLGGEASDQGLIVMRMAPAPTITGVPFDARTGECHTAGEALKELHTAPPGALTHALGDPYLSTQVSRMQTALGSLAHNADEVERLGLPPSDLSRVGTRATSHLLAHPGPNAIIHADYHAGNVCVGPESQTACLLDTGDLVKSVDASGHPVGSAARDVTQFLYRLEREGRGKGFGMDVIHENQEAFLAGYGDAIRYVQPEAAHFYSTLAMFDELAFVAAGRDPAVRSRLADEGFDATARAILNGNVPGLTT